MKIWLKNLRKGVKTTWKKGKKSYVKSKPIRKGIIKGARRVSGNIDNYFASERQQIRNIRKYGL